MVDLSQRRRWSQDIKIVLRLLPLLICTVTLSLSTVNGSFAGHYITTSSSFANCFIRDSVTEVVLLVFIVPLFQLFIIPCFYSFIPNMLRRMGIGLFLLMLSQCGYAILEVVGLLGCLFFFWGGGIVEHLGYMLGYSQREAEWAHLDTWVGQIITRSPCIVYCVHV